jgi:2-dehydro-3-deoxygluconokinase
MNHYDLTTLGETMLRLSVPAGKRLESAQRFDVHPGGAESNVASLLARLGRRTAWCGALPDSALGRRVAGDLRAAGVAVEHIAWRASGRIGTYYVEFSLPPRPIQVIYDRADSCAAQLGPTDLAWDALLTTRLLHLTGITPALSPTCRALTAEAIARARAAHLPISFDVNYREKLWPPAEAAAVLRPLIAGVDLLFCGQGDAQRLFGCRGAAEAMLAQLAALSGARTVVMSIGDGGVLATVDGVVLATEAAPVGLIDRLGAGDALAAGVIDGWLDGDLAAGLRRGVVLAALALSQHGDMVVTTRAELEVLSAGQGAAVQR